MLRTTHYVGAGFALLFAAGNVLACSPSPGAQLLCNEPLDIIESADGFDIVQRQTRRDDRQSPAPTQRVGNSVWFDAAIRTLGHQPPTLIYHLQETSR